MRGLRPARPARSDDGASAVEFALLFPLFIMLAIGTISAGFAFHAWLNVTHGAQEASRFAATLSVASGGGTADSWLEQVTERALAASSLTIDATHAKPGTKACAAVVSPTSFPVVSRHVVVTTDGDGVISRAYADGPCPGMSTMVGDYVQLSVSQPTNFNYVFAAATIEVGSSSVNRFEAVSYS